MKGSGLLNLRIPNDLLDRRKDAKSQTGIDVKWLVKGQNIAPNYVTLDLLYSTSPESPHSSSLGL